MKVLRPRASPPHRVPDRGRPRRDQRRLRADSPFGGFKQSGIGREYGAYGLEGYLEPRAVME
jgi:hypothetical protein